MADHDSERSGLSAPVAPYLQIAATLRSRIESGEYEPRQRLPSIVDLIQEYGAARLTANKALRLLVTEGADGAVTGMGFNVRTDIGQN